jgi:hypothetical protein
MGVISVTPQTDVPPKPVKVVVAEDEVLVRLMVAEVLRGEGFQVFEASNGQDERHRRRNGAGQIRSPGVSLVLASAQAPPITEDLTFDASFIKPYPPDDIANWIRRRHTSTRDHAESGLG